MLTYIFALFYGFIWMAAAVRLSTTDWDDAVNIVSARTLLVGLISFLVATGGGYWVANEYRLLGSLALLSIWGLVIVVVYVIQEYQRRVNPPDYNP